MIAESGKMPGKYRYSATFDATYLEEDPSPTPHTLVTVSSWRSNSSSGASDHHPSHARSGSVDSLDSNGGSSGSSSVGHSRQVSADGEFIPTRTMTKAATKPAHNPLQFVKVGQCPLYKQAEQQLKLAKEVKSTREKHKDVEEEWQSNLDNWKSRRKKVTEKVIQRAEEMRQIEIEEQLRQQARKTKTFSEMLEERSQRKRFNLSLYSDPSFNDDSDLHDLRPSAKHEHETNGNSLDNATCIQEKLGHNGTSNPVGTQGDCLTEQNVYRFSSEDELEYRDSLSDSNSRVCGVPCERDALCSKDTSKDDGATFVNTDSGLESLNSSQRAGDAPDSASDFSQDSASVIDKNTEDELDTHSVVGEITTGTELLEEFSSRNQVTPTSAHEKEDGIQLNFRIWLRHSPEAKDFGFTLKDILPKDHAVVVDSVSSGSPSDIAGLKPGDEVLAINGEDARGRSHAALVFAVKQSLYIGQLNLLVWRPSRPGFQTENATAPPKNKRAAAFEEKRALFAASSSEKCTSGTDRRTDNKNADNLVTRRRSTFESIFQERDDTKDGSHTTADIMPPTNFRERLASFEKKAVKQNGQSKAHGKNDSPRKPPPIPVKPKLKPCPPSNPNARTDTYADSVSSGSDGASDETMSNGVVHSRHCSLDSENEMYVDDIHDLASVMALPNETSTLGHPDLGKNSLLDDVGNRDRSESDVSASHNQDSPPDNPNRVSKRVEELPKPQEPKIIEAKRPPESQETATTSTATNRDPDEGETTNTSPPTRFVTLHPVQDTSGLHIIYHSHPKTSAHPNDNEPQTNSNHASEHGLDQVSNDASIAITLATSTTSPQITKESSLPLLLTEESLQISADGKNPTEKDHSVSVPLTVDEILSGSDNVILEASTPDVDLFFEDFVAPPKHAEPPREKPPPPPVDDMRRNTKPKLSDSTFISAKQIKKELWKRRSNFLGLGEGGAMPDLDSTSLRPPPAIEDILKTEREIERLHRQQIEQQLLGRTHEMDDEIARKEREIIENLEREEKERIEQDGEKDEQELFLTGQSAATNLAEDEERIKRLQEERRRMEEERIQTEEQRMMRIEEHKHGHMRPHETSMAPVPPTIQLPNFKEQKRAVLPENRDVILKLDMTTGSSKTSPVGGSPSAPIPIPRHDNRDNRSSSATYGSFGRDDIISASRQPQGLEVPCGEDYSYSPKSTVMSPDPPAKPPRSDPRYASDSPSHQPPQIMTRQSLHSVSVTPKAKIGQNEHWLKDDPCIPGNKRRSDPCPRERGYNQNHWLVQEAEIRRLKEQDERRWLSERWHTLPDPIRYDPLASTVDDFGVPLLRQQHQSSYDSLVSPFQTHRARAQRLSQQYPVEQEWNYGHTAPMMTPSRSFSGHQASLYKHERCYSQYTSPYGKGCNNGGGFQPTHAGLRPSRSMPDMQEQILSVSGKKKCSHCGSELGRGAAMIIESLQLYYHIQCFCCCVCQAQLGNGSCGTDVRVRNNKLHCQNCYSNDEAGLKFSRV